MERISGSLRSRSVSKRTFWIIGAIVVAALLSFIVVAGFPGTIAVYELYWSKHNIERLFYEDLGLSQSWSSFIAVVASFFYALVWVPLTFWTYRVFVWKFSAKQLSVAFICWVIVYGHVPLMHALLGADACFNQRTGQPIKWYVQDIDGRIVLFDSSGFDTTTGVEKHLATSEICQAFAHQKIGSRPRRILVDVREIQFFDAVTGRPHVWYLKALDGSFELFDSSGYHPVTSEPLRPVTKDVVAEILKQVADAEAARREAQAAEARRQADLNAAAEAEAARKQAEADQAKRQAAEAKRQADLKAAAQAEAASKQAAAEAEVARRQAEAAKVRKQAAQLAQMLGLWRTNSGSVIRLERNGTGIRGVLALASEGAKRGGVADGDEMLSGTVEGNTLAAKQLFGMSEGVRRNCPHISAWQDITYTLTNPGHLEGNLQTTRIDENSCRVTATSPFLVVMTRASKADLDATSRSATTANGGRSPTLKLSVPTFSVHPSNSYVGENSRINFLLENHGSVAVGVALKDHGFTAGSCAQGGWNPAVAGLNVVDSGSGFENVRRSLTWIAPGTSLNASISIASPDCNLTMFSGAQNTAVTLTFVTSTGSELETTALTAQNVSINPLGARYDGGSYFTGSGGFR